ncbi:hypothetical protein B0H17DRAFT_1327758 [Mycena rosella]|uniref:Alpha-type protein kinase domain-containing protein n=1 Tax=Mycena rosella TaxID=1033263 RepID=A0AAD7DVD1_MYCRO|nr:hypothetical protein B0H17DRAFT_1327758 [Mycena rosella]
MSKPMASKTGKSVIELDSDSAGGGSDSDIQEVPAMSALKTKIAQNKQTASGIRPTPKAEPDPDLSVRTQEFLQKRAASRKRATGSSKAASVLFKVTVALQKQAGQKQGTRVPLQSRGFQLDDNMDYVLCTMVDMVNEPDGKWTKEHPGKGFTRDDVQFTFNPGMEIPLKYRMSDCTVATFWNKFTKQDNQYFKKASIAACIAEITMLVPIEITLDPVIESESSDHEPDIFDEILGAGKHRRKFKGKSKARKRAKVKQEESDTTLRVKDEPMELELYRTRSASVTRAKSALTRTIHLTSPIMFTKEFYSNPLDHRLPSTEKFHGFRDLCSKSTPALGSHSSLVEKITSSIDGESTGYTTPALFIATVHEQGTVLGHLVYQPKPSISLNNIVKPELEILSAMTHFSFTQSKNTQIIVDFKVASGDDGPVIIFAPVTHSFSGGSGLGDDGPEAIEELRMSHKCNTICQNFDLILL